jgi:hypothetical protein
LSVPRKPKKEIAASVGQLEHLGAFERWLRQMREPVERQRRLVQQSIDALVGSLPRALTPPPIKLPPLPCAVGTPVFLDHQPDDERRLARAIRAALADLVPAALPSSRHPGLDEAIVTRLTERGHPVRGEGWKAFHHAVRVAAHSTASNRTIERRVVALWPPIRQKHDKLS